MKRWLEMVLEEPYRLFFGLGVLTGMVGVLMWPAFDAGWLGWYPGESHARLMVCGFVGAFVLGFLGTAFPRLAGNLRWRWWEGLLLFGMWGGMVLAYGTGNIRSGDGLFAIWLLVVCAGMVLRWVRKGRDTPPPGFVLVLCGLAAGIWGARYLASGKVGSVTSWRMARLCVYQAWLLLPVLGIGPYLFPRFWGHPSDHAFDTSRTPPPGWWGKAAASGAIGLWMMLGFWLEAIGWDLWGQSMRAAGLLLWFGLETPVFRKCGLQQTTPGTAVRWALFSAATGLLVAGLSPAARVGSLHMYFASGIGLLALAAGTRVVLGHAGRHDLLSGKIVWLRWVIGLAFLAALTRMTSDWIPRVRTSHILYAAWTWCLACGIWLVALGRHAFAVEPDEATAKPKPSCPRKKRRNS